MKIYSTRRLLAIILFVCVSLIVACGGGGGGGSSPAPTLPMQPVFTQPPVVAAVAAFQLEQVKGFTFTWTDVSDATFYRLQENPDGASGFSQVGADILPALGAVTIAVPLYERTNATYMLQSCNPIGCVDDAIVSVGVSLADAIGYFKASNAEEDDQFGVLSLSGDGTTLAVSATGDDSDATGTSAGINQNNSNPAGTNSGAVYVFSRNGSNWLQQAYIKASNTEANDQFGTVLSLSNDGNTLAVGARGEDSDGTSGESDNSALGSGAVYVFNRTGTSWSQQEYIKASNAEGGDQFGASVGLSGDGNTLAVGATGEDSSDPMNESDNLDGDSGAIYVYSRSGSVWSQQAYLKANNTDPSDEFGGSLSLSGDGNTLAVGSRNEDSGATGVSNGSSNNSEVDSGAVYMFSRSGSIWSHQAYIKASNTDASDQFGEFLSLSVDGSTLAVGARKEASNAMTVNGTENDNSSVDSGAAYVFSYDGSVWSQQAYVKASNAEAGDQFGVSLSLSGDGNVLAVGSLREDSNATSINGNESDNTVLFSGAVYIFNRVAGIWSKQSYIKSSNAGAGDQFGEFLNLSNDGNTLAVGSRNEGSNATGIGGNQVNNAALGSGAVYLY